MRIHEPISTHFTTSQQHEASFSPSSHLKFVGPDAVGLQKKTHIFIHPFLISCSHTNILYIHISIYIYICVCVYIYVYICRSFLLFFFFDDENGAKTPSFYNYKKKQSKLTKKSHIMKIEGGENSNINIIINNNYNKYNICTIINGAVVDVAGLNLRYPVHPS